MKKFNLTLIVSLSLVASVFIIGCGGGSSDSTSSSIVNGQLIDDYLYNVDYVCNDGSSDVTDIEGRFSCASLPVSFRIGGLKLGEISVMPFDSHVFPQDLLHVTRDDVNDTNVTAMARLLQSLDDDNNVSNGIYISDETKSVFSSSEDFNASDIATYASDAGVVLISEVDAIANLQVSLDSIQEEYGAISQELYNTLSYMGNEERLAYDIYNTLYGIHPDANQLDNIANDSEKSHIEAVQALVRKYVTDYSEFSNVDLTELGYKDTNVTDMVTGVYDISSIQDLYDALLVKGSQSKQDALEVGCMVEVIDIIDLDEYIELAEHSNVDDIISTFTNLRNGSYSHYDTFDTALKNMGVEDGCCSLGTIDGINYCQTYP